MLNDHLPNLRKADRSRRALQNLVCGFHSNAIHAATTMRARLLKAIERDNRGRDDTNELCKLIQTLINVVRLEADIANIPMGYGKRQSKTVDAESRVITEEELAKQAEEILKSEGIVVVQKSGAGVKS